MPGPEAPQRPLLEVARYFLRLGVIAFGGPAAHIALMRRDLVSRRGWVTDEEFVDLLGVTNLIPGPNSTEMTMYLGGQRAGWRGMWVGGAAFILPAVAIVLGFAVAYDHWGTTPAGRDLLYGVTPFMLAIIAQAIWGLRRATIKGVHTAVVAVAAAAGSVLGIHEAFLILGAGAITSAIIWLPRLVRLVRTRRASRQMALLPLLPFLTGADGWKTFLIFLRIGAVLYGSGYVLVAFLQRDLVDQRHWLTEQQLVDAIAVGQFTPGPVFSSATFVGYLVAGFPGALAATAGIFLPSFVLVTVTRPFIPRLRKSPWAAPFLDGVNAAAVALMVVVTVNLARETLTDPFAAALFVLGAVVLIRWSPNSAWFVLAGAAAGFAHGIVG